MNVYWLCGGTSSGKSSVARAIHRQMGIPVVHLDHRQVPNIDHCDRRRHRELASWRRLLRAGHSLGDITMRWYARSAWRQKRRWRRWYAEQLDMTVQQLGGRGAASLAEGVVDVRRLLRVAPPERVVALYATDAYRRSQQRQLRHSDPYLAAPEMIQSLQQWRRNHPERGGRAIRRGQRVGRWFARRQLRALRRAGVPIVWNDGSKSVAALAREVRVILGLRA